jgi:hypothetical protein
MSEKQAAKDSIENAEGVTPEHELKAALDEPAGSTRFSGASAGIKAEGDGPDSTRVYDTPKAALKAEREAAKEADKIREIQEATQSRQLLSNVPDSPTGTAFANAPEKGDPESITVYQAGSGVVLSTTANVLHFDREEALSLQRVLTAATRVV